MKGQKHVSLSRMEILDAHGLKLGHFNNQEDAWTNADRLIEVQRALPTFASITDVYPDIVEGFKNLDRFYYVNHEGAKCNMHHLVIVALAPHGNSANTGAICQRCDLPCIGLT